MKQKRFLGIGPSILRIERQGRIQQCYFPFEALFVEGLIAIDLKQEVLRSGIIRATRFQCGTLTPGLQILSAAASFCRDVSLNVERFADRPIYKPPTTVPDHRPGRLPAVC